MVDVVSSLSPPYLPVDGSGVEEVMAVLNLEEDEEEAKHRARQRREKAGGEGDGTQGLPFELSVRGVMDWFGGLTDDQKRNVFKVRDTTLPCLSSSLGVLSTGVSLVFTSLLSHSPDSFTPTRSCWRVWRCYTARTSARSSIWMRPTWT